MTRPASGSTPALAARRLVDFSGPHGWEHSATNLGRSSAVAAARATASAAARRRVLPLVEVRAEFAISRAELRDDDRGAADADLEPLDAAARQIAVAENKAVFHGWADASIRGSPRPRRIGDRSSAGRRRLPPAGGRRGRAAAASGIAGPYALALGGDQYKRVVQTAEHGGYPLLEHLRKIIEGPIVWAPGVKGAVLVSQRGGDFLFESGPGPLDRLSRPRRRRRPAVPRGELQLPRRHARGGGRFDGVGARAGRSPPILRRTATPSRDLPRSSGSARVLQQTCGRWCDLSQTVGRDGH